MMRTTVLVTAALLAGCGGSASTPPALTASGARESASFAGPQSRVSGSCATAACIYVASIHILYEKNPTEVAEWPTQANGDIRPTARIKGHKTALSFPVAVAVDNVHNLYVANNLSPSSSGTITVYAAGHDGNVPPAQDIVGSATGLVYPYGIAVDRERDMYVANSDGGSSHIGSITVYAAGATGNVAPVRTITGSNTGLGFPDGVVLGARGEIYVTNDDTNSVTVYANRANGNVAPIRTISGAMTGLSQPSGIALDSEGHVYVANDYDSTVTVYAADAHGNVAPIRTIAGARTKLNCNT